MERSSLRILFIDDSMDDVSLLIFELGKFYRLIWQSVHNEASLIVSLGHPWDVVLCDYSLPGFSAKKALETIRNNWDPSQLPVIIISGVVDEDVAIELLKYGANDFIPKDKIGRLHLAIERELRIVREHSDQELKTLFKIEVSYEQTIEAWGLALELRDVYTIGHTKRAADMSLRLAMKLGVSHKDFSNLNRGALLHDIGKMGIPDAILLKRDSLTIEEMEIMKQHPVIACKMLQHIPFLKDCLDVVCYHHERWNGSGYPSHLVGENIPRLARLFAVIDVYDALVTDRPYRPSWEKSKAIAYLLEEAGKTFDPEMVEAFVDMIGRA